MTPRYGAFGFGSGLLYGGALSTSTGSSTGSTGSTSAPSTASAVRPREGSWLERLEVWSDAQAAGGTRLAVIQAWVSATDKITLAGIETAQFQLLRSLDKWSYITERRVIRTVFRSGGWKEWRIVGIKQGRTAEGLTGSVQCEGIRYDLGQGLVTRTEANGDVNPYFELYGLHPLNHASRAIESAPSHFRLGYVSTGAQNIDVVYDWDTPLSALSEIATQSGLELDVVQGSTKYTVQMVDAIASTIPHIYLRHAMNLIGTERDADVRQTMATRVYPKGGGDQGDRISISDASWVVSSVSSKTVYLSTVDGSPIRFGSQLNGLYARPISGSPSASTLRAVVTSRSTDQAIVLAGASHGITAGDRVLFRVGTSEAALVYLQDPAAVATYGTVVKVLDRPDIPPIDNLVANPFLEGAMSFGAPSGWGVVGSVITSANTNTLHRRYGTQSVRVIASSSNAGLQTDPITIFPSSDSPFFTGQITLLVKSGTVKLELIDESSTQDGIYPPEGSEPAFTSVRDTWVENLAIAGIDLWQVNSTSVRLRVTALSTIGAEWYMDAAQLTQTAGGADAFYGKRASNSLWIAGNEYLYDYAAPSVSFAVNVADLAREYPDEVPEGIEVGGVVNIIDDDLGLNFRTRVIERMRDLSQPGVTSIVLSNRPEDMSGLGVPGRRGKRTLTPTESKHRRPTVELRRVGSFSTYAAYEVKARTDGELVAAYYATYASSASPGTFTRSPASGWAESGHAVTVNVSRPGAGTPTRSIEVYSIDKTGARSDRLVATVDGSPLADMVSLSVNVRDSDGSARVAASADNDSRWIKVAYQIDYPANLTVYPTESDLTGASTINGRLRGLSTSSTIGWALPAGTVKIGQALRVIAAAFPTKSTDVTNHGSMLWDADIRSDKVPSLLESGSTEGTIYAGHAVTVIDPSTWQAKKLYWRTKSGSGSPGSWTLLDSRSTGALTDGVRYSRTVLLVEKHQSFIEWRLLYDTNDSTGNAVPFISPGFDKGPIPDVAITGNLSTAGSVSADWQGDFDTRSVKIVAKSTGKPTIAAIRAATVRDGRVGTATSLATLTAGQTGWIGCLGYGTTGGGGSESSTAFFTSVTYDPPPPAAATLTVTSFIAYYNGTGMEFTVYWDVTNGSTGNRVAVDFLEQGKALAARSDLAITSSPTTGTKATWTPSTGPIYSARVFYTSSTGGILLTAQSRAILRSS